MKRSWGYIIAMHSICWLSFLSLPAAFIAGLGNRASTLFTPAWAYFTSYILIFYLHTGFLFPKLYFGKKYILYFLSILILATGIFYLRPFDHLARLGKTRDHSPQVSNSFSGATDRSSLSTGSNGPGQSTTLHPTGFNKNNFKRPKVDIISITLFFLLIAVSITLLIIKRWKLALEHAARAETDKVNAELSFLKAQIDPHFLFNTLNNIYSLAVRKDDNTAESIMKLSNIMRYVTDEAKDNFVSLRNETNFITNYIELQRLRLGSKITLDFAVSGNLRDKLIAPLILITFIENVFKYGISNSEPSTITIDLKADNNTINFFCRNKMFPLKHHAEGTGIGISNATRRLDYLYPGRYLLNIKKDDDYYSVNLILQT